MELYYQSSDSLTLTIYSNGVPQNADTTPTVTITQLATDTVIVTAGGTSLVSTGKYNYVLTTANNSVTGKYRAVWTYIVSGVTSTKTEYYEVVVGYTTATAVRDAYPSLASKSNDEIYRYEKLARRIINAFCNQSFDFEDSVKKRVRGRTENLLEMPRRLYNLEEVLIDDVDDVTTEIQIWDDYWIAPINSVAPGFFIRDVKRGLVDPGKYFRGGIEYFVTGDWGWESVPEEIQMATILLINDYFCDSIMLRQHGIYQSQLGDRSMTLKADLWGTTGNYDVDILLSAYTLVLMRLI